MTRKKVGDTIRWTYKGAGTYRARRGKVLAVVDANEDARARLHGLRGKVPRSRATFRDARPEARYLVEVEQIGHGGEPKEPLFFAVPVAKIDAELAAEALHATMRD